MNSPIRITDKIWPNSTTPVVSVFNWVYNHKDFIRQSIESILMQETTFPVEIIIQDDASNDGTREIIEEYQNNYPHLFNNILFAENQYSQGKSIMNGLFEKPRGKYIALAHGDDYWTDPLKLQKQVDFLERNRNFYAVTHNCQIIYEYDKSLNYTFRGKTISSLSEIINTGISASTNSFLLKKESVNIFLKINFQYYLKYGKYPVFGDITLNMSILFEGKIFNINESMSVYRRHKGGVSSSSLFLSNYKNDYIRLLKVINEMTNKRYIKEINNRIFELIKNVSSNYIIRRIKLILFKLSINGKFKF
jgi:glycosyltransferase involved in cell wall biosynthesis